MEFLRVCAYSLIPLLASSATATHLQTQGPISTLNLSNLKVELPGYLISAFEADV